MPGRYRHGLGSDGTATLDIPGGIADDINPLWRKLDAVTLMRAGTSEFPQLIAVMVIIRKGTELEKIPNPIVRELDLRPAREISRE